MQEELENLRQELSRILDLRDKVIKSDYQSFRNLLKKICEKIQLHPTILPLFPQRREANVINCHLYQALGIPYFTKPLIKEPPWAHQKKEKWIELNARVEELKIPGERHVIINYKYQIDNQEYRHVYEFEQDFMHLLSWYWDAKEVEHFFAKGKEIPCLVSDENPYRHIVWTPY